VKDLDCKMQVSLAPTWIRAIRTFKRFLVRSPDTASPEDLRRAWLHQSQRDLYGSSAPASSSRRRRVQV